MHLHEKSHFLSNDVVFVKKVKKKENKITLGVAISVKMVFNGTCRHKSFVNTKKKYFGGQQK